MSKRRADKQLTADNYAQEDEPTNDVGGITYASDEVRKTRKILTGRRRLGTSALGGKFLTFFWIDS